MTTSNLPENDLDSLPSVQPQPAAVRNNPSAVRTVIAPDPGYDGVAYTKCRCGKWFHTGWFQRHDCLPIDTGTREAAPAAEADDLTADDMRS